MIPRIPTITSLTTKLETVQARSQTRTLALREVACARAAYATLLRYCAAHGLVQPELHLDGGAVANSYTYRAESTHLRFRLDAETHAVVTDLCRDWARKKPGGGPGQLRLHIVKPAEDPRKWADLPAFRFQGKRHVFRKDGYLYL